MIVTHKYSFWYKLGETEKLFEEDRYFFIVVFAEGCLQAAWKWHLFLFTIPQKRLDWSQFVITDVEIQKPWHQWIIKHAYIVKIKKIMRLEIRMSDSEDVSVKSPLSISHISKQLWFGWNLLRGADNSIKYERLPPLMIHHWSLYFWVFQLLFIGLYPELCCKLQHCSLRFIGFLYYIDLHPRYHITILVKEKQN